MYVWPDFLQWCHVCFGLDGVGLAGVGGALRCVLFSAAYCASNAELTAVWIMVETVASLMVSVTLVVVFIVEAG